MRRGLDPALVSFRRLTAGYVFASTFTFTFAFSSSCRPAPEPELPDGPVAWSVTASQDKREVQVGEDLILTLTLTHPADGDFQPPPSVSFEPFDVIALDTETVSPVETRLHYRLAAYQLPESLEIPALEIRYRDEADVVRVLATEPRPVELVTSLTPDVTDIHDIKGPVELLVARDLSLLLWLLLALLLALIAYLIYRKLKKTPEGLATRISVPPPPPADVEAEAALRRLAAKKLVEQGRAPAFFAELSEIMKRYAGRRFEVPYLERTSREILDDLGVRPAGEDLRAILDTSDRVKFAKLSPGPDKAWSMFALAERYLAETRPRPEPASGAASGPDASGGTHIGPGTESGTGHNEARKKEQDEAVVS